MASINKPNEVKSSSYQNDVAFGKEERRKQLLDTDFNYEIVRNEYYKHLEEFYMDKPEIMHKPWNYATILNFILKLQAPNGYSNMYEVIRVEGEDILIRKRRSLIEPIRRIPIPERCFDLIVNAHTASGHCSKSAIKLKLKSRCLCAPPYFCIQAVLNSCNVCNNKVPNSVRERIEINYQKTNWEISICEVYTPSEMFHYVMVYTEISTRYTLIRPLMKKCPQEIAMELTKIFFEFGPPLNLRTHVSHVSCITQAVHILSEFFPGCPIPTGFNVDNKENVRILQALNDWRHETNSPNWELGCFIVQWRLNTTKRTIPNDILISKVVVGVPYNMFFGSKANAFNYISSDEINKTTSANIIDLENTDSEGDAENVVTTNDEWKTAEQIKMVAEAEKKYADCCVCNVKLVWQFSCNICKKPIHSNCGKIIYHDTDYPFVYKMLCPSCDH